MKPDTVVMSAVEIPLTRGMVALVDNEDAALVLAHNWHAFPGCRTWYAQTSVRIEKGQAAGSARRQANLQMHRLILGLRAGDPDVDHINGDGLDNRRANLRLATASQNSANRHHLPTNTSGFRGVTYRAAQRKWQAIVRHKRRGHYLGVFADPEDAARAYDRKARELFGEFARPNFEVAT